MNKQTNAEYISAKTATNGMAIENLILQHNTLIDLFVFHLTHHQCIQNS